jgi:hypothetical protein
MPIEVAWLRTRRQPEKTMCTHKAEKAERPETGPALAYETPIIIK